MGPEWLMPLTRPLIVGGSALVALAWWLRSGPDRNRDDVLGVLALVFLLRCMLDPWDLIYYHLPLIVSLAAWEARRGRSLPVLAVVASAGVLADLRHLSTRAPGTVRTSRTWRGRSRWPSASP